jgi:hypothetical protein
VAYFKVSSPDSPGETEEKLLNMLSKKLVKSEHLQSFTAAQSWFENVCFFFA